LLLKAKHKKDKGYEIKRKNTINKDSENNDAHINDYNKPNFHNDNSENFTLIKAVGV
jgi:hypothetical protein